MDFGKSALFWGLVLENAKSPGGVLYLFLRPKTRLKRWYKPFVPTPPHLRARDPKKVPKTENFKKTQKIEKNFEIFKNAIPGEKTIFECQNFVG